MLDLGTDSTGDRRLPADLRRGRPRRARRRGRRRHRPRRQRPGRAARRQQGPRRARRAVQRPVHRPLRPAAQRRQRAVDRRPGRRRRASPRRSSPRSWPPRSRAAATRAASAEITAIEQERVGPRRRTRRCHHRGAAMPFPTDTEPDTELFALIDRELERQTTGHPAHRQRELHLAGGDARRRLGADQQVHRGLPGQALLRRQRGRSTTSSRWPSSGSRRCSAPTTPTSSRTAGPTPTCAPTRRCSSPATPCSA